MSDDTSPASTAARRRVSLRVAFEGPALPRCQLLQAASRFAQVALLVVLSVHLFDRGGASLLALFGVVRTAVPAVANPVVTTALGRVRPGRALAAALGLSALGAAGLAVLVAATAPVVAILAVDAAVSVLLNATRPLVTSLLPSYLRGPDELVATNAASALVESLSVAIGPVAAGVTLGAVGAVPAIGGLAAMLAAAAVVALGLPDVVRDRSAGLSLSREVVEGANAVLRAPDTRIVLVLMIGQAFLRGSMNVFVVGLAIERLGLGDGGVGLLLGAVGVGGLVVLPVAARLPRPGRSARVLGLAVALWGVPFVAAALTVSDPLVVTLFGVVGAANTLADISTDTLLQRVVPNGSLPTALGFFEAVLFLAMGVGSLATGLLLGVTSLPVVMVLVGAVTPVLAIVAARRLVELDRAMRHRDVGISVLQLNAVLSPLVLTTIDRLVSRTRTTIHPVDDVIVREGEPGDRFYVVESGEVEVLRGGRSVAVLGPGDCFGEMALLDDAPRNATVVARAGVTTRSLAREDFLTTVARDDEALRAATTLAERRRPRPPDPAGPAA